MKSYTIKIDGMSCPMCETHVNDILRNKFNLKKVKSSFKTKEAHAIGNVDLNKNDMNKIFKDYGYKVYKIVEKPYQKKGLFSFFK